MLYFDCKTRFICSIFIHLCSSVNVHFLHLLILMLLLSGDVESNPGPDSFTSVNTPGVISLLHLNIRSIRHKLNYIFDNCNDFDVLCFTETHLDTQIEDTFLLNQCSDFTLYRKDVSSFSGGVALYVKNSVYSRRRLDLELITIQSIWLAVNYVQLRKSGFITRRILIA